MRGAGEPRECVDRARGSARSPMAGRTPGPSLRGRQATDGRSLEGPEQQEPEEDEEAGLGEHEPERLPERTRAPAPAAAPSLPPTETRATMSRMISFVPSRIWCTRRSRTIFSMP